MDTKTSSCQAKDAAYKNGKPFCKVCFDAGKPAKEYTSHYVKSTPGPTGKVVCPTLLIQACLNCGQPGHTSGYCDQAKSQHNHRSNQPNQSNQSNQHRTQPTIVLSPMIGAEAELKLMTTMFKSKTKNDDFPSLKSEPEKQEPQHKQEPKEEPTHGHVYNPKSNAFGALSQKQPKQSKQPNQKSFQPPKESPAKPMTMAERLKNPAPIKPEPKPTPVETAPIRPKFADMPPKSQFWWQDEV